MDIDWLLTTSPPTTESLHLIHACLRGDDLAYDALYQQHVAYIYRLAYSLLQNREDAEEVLQDSFEYAFRTLHRYDPHKASFKTWLYQITVSRCRNKRRRKWLPTFAWQHLPGEAQLPADEPLLDEQMVLNEQQKLVWHALSQLTPKLRETAVLRYYENLSYQEIGHIVGASAKTVESRMRLARQSLKNILQDQLSDLIL
ncbi:MAG TPA: RNA polymerase sigma factor [Anaerolineae bacterium]|nr:RNA polymerase sigma factor [Anaerolineae bacterium]